MNAHTTAMRMILALAIAFSLTARLCGETVTPYVAMRYIEGGFSGEDAHLYVSKAPDDTGRVHPVLFWSDPFSTGSLSRVLDPRVIRRGTEIMKRVDPPDWWAEFTTGNAGPGANGPRMTDEGAFRFADHMIHARTVSFTVRVKDGLSISRIDYDVVECREDTWDGSGDTPELPVVSLAISGGSAQFSAKTPAYSGSQKRYTVAVRINGVYAYSDGENPNSRIDDMTVTDYSFTDTIGRTSLGTIREWVSGLTENRLADSWSHFPATSPLVMDGKQITLDSGGATYLQSKSESGVQRVRLYVEGNRVLDIMAPGVSAVGEFGVCGMEYVQTNETFILYVPAGHGDYMVQSCTNIDEQAWETVPSVRYDTKYTYSDDVRDPSLAGRTIDAVALAVEIDLPKNGQASGTTVTRFWRVAADSVSYDGAVLARQPVFAGSGIVLKDDSGQWWKISVSTNGTLSTSRVANPPNE